MTNSLSLSGDLDLLLPITALFPLTAILLVTQGNPYQTLVLRGILGSVATLLYALLGAPDVALTEALVGTLLSTTLYAVALRSAMALRLHDRRPPTSAAAAGAAEADSVEKQLADWISPLYLRLRLVSDPPDAEAARQRLHGWLESDRRLVLRRSVLAERLQACRGYQHWLEQGGELLIAEEGQP
ncbi:MAG: hydrogenase subunit MbhD domain-containing protein [Cyanobacteriota bacterium]|jgi:putative multicomponent Na+:H+ antiporter subunit B|nr:hydrogenase subunit MbhD domain-containing protein [Cyanobacteriota bacterium]